jgi:YD repeat-containing protein
VRKNLVLGIAFALVIVVSLIVVVALDVYRVTDDDDDSINSVSVADGDGHVFLFWQDDSSGNYAIYYEMIDAGSPPIFGNKTQLSAGSGDSTNPSASIDGTVIHVAWQDNRDGNWEIYYRKLTTSGVFLCNDTRLTNTVGESVLPTISSGNGTIFAAWSENEAGIYKIYYNMISAFENQAPVANFSFAPEHPTCADTVQFTDDSTDFDGTIISWNWRFGDGNESFLKNTSREYAESGTYTVNLTIIDDFGAYGYAEKDITITNLPSVANFSYFPLSPTTDNIVEFTDMSEDPDGTIVNWTWDFGDSSISYERNATNQYSLAGDYTVNLTVIDNNGANDSIEKTVSVADAPLTNVPPIAPANPSPSNGATGIETDVIMEWQCSDPNGDELDYDVYFGTNPASLSKITSTRTNLTHCSPGALEYLAKYYWKVNASDGEFFNESEVWNFTTKQDNVPPEITLSGDSPDPQILGGNVNITAEVSDDIMVSAVKVRISGPAGFSPINTTMSGAIPEYYYNATYSIAGTYTHSIWAQDSSGNWNVSSGHTFTIITVPTAPRSLNAVPGNQWINLTWSAPSSNGGSAITSYKIYRNGTLGAYATRTPSPLWYNDTSVANGVSYTYNVSAVNSVGEGSTFGNITAIPRTVPSKVTGLTATAGNAQVSLSWNVPANGGSAITGYKIYRGTASGGETYLTTVTVTSYTNTGLTNGVAYYYKVSAVSAVSEGAMSDEASATPQAPSSPPSPPTPPTPPVTPEEHENGTASNSTLDDLNDEFGTNLDEPFYANDTDGDGVYDTFTDPNGALGVVRNVSVGENGSFLISMDNDTLPEFIWDPQNDTIVPVTPEAPISINVTVTEDEVTITVAINKTGWVYVYLADEYTNQTLLRIQTIDGRIISSDRIWRENGKIYFLDDPSTFYEIVYQAEVPPADTIKPAISIVLPAVNSIVKDIIEITVEATDNIGVIKVEFSIDGTLTFTDVLAPYKWQWNTTGVSDGNHTITAKAYDPAGNLKEDSRTVKVQNNEPVQPTPEKKTSWLMYVAVFLVIVFIAFAVFVAVRFIKNELKGKTSKFELVEDEKKQDAAVGKFEIVEVPAFELVKMSMFELQKDNMDKKPNRKKK